MNKPPTHETESRAHRKQQRDLAAARQSGTVAPAVDTATGQMISAWFSVVFFSVF